VWPSDEYLPSYRALERGWSPDNLRPEAAAEQLAQVQADPRAFLEGLVVLEPQGRTVTLPDGSKVPRLPGYRRWMTKALALLLPEARKEGLSYVEITTDPGNLYIGADDAEQVELLARLGKHRRGKACLYFKGLADLDSGVLEALIARSVAALQRRHPHNAT
jgi:hypothetical protein